jgi:hypothetical protein
MVSTTILRDEALATGCISSWRQKDREVRVIMKTLFAFEDGSIRPTKALTKTLRKFLNRTLMEIGTPKDKDLCPRMLAGLTVARLVCASCGEARKGVRGGRSCFVWIAMVVLLVQKSRVLQQGVSERPLARAQGQLCDLSKVTDRSSLRSFD